MADDFKIESGIPIPQKWSNRGLSGLRAAISQLEVGQSIFVPRNEKKMAKFRAQLSATATQILGPGNVTTRTVEGGVRMWRIA